MSGFEFRPAQVGDTGAMGELDGSWKVERVSGALPPLYGVEKRIEGQRGQTRFGPVPFRFDVDGLRLRYRFPLSGLVDELTPEHEPAAAAAADPRVTGYNGRTFVLGREIGRFRMTRRAHTSASA
jgi:hypothetical protein